MNCENFLFKIPVINYYFEMSVTFRLLINMFPEIYFLLECECAGCLWCLFEKPSFIG